MFIDDVAMYTGSVDTTAPNSPTLPSATVGNAQLTLSWTAASGDVDGGGYMVVRGTSDPTAAPNVNGIYATGNNVFTGQRVVYVGTSTTFTDSSLSNGTTYYYRIYTFDKAYNYSSAATISGVPAVPVATISGAATATAFTTTYGTASTVQSFSVSGSNLTANLVATAPTGFEVSADGTTYGSTATFTQTSGSASGTLRVRLAANAAVSGTYNSLNIVLSSTGATTVNIVTASTGNTVAAKGLMITGLTAENKNWDDTTTATVTGTAAFSGLISGDSSLTPGGSVTWAFADANVGTNKTLNRTGSYTVSSSNYSLTQPTLTASIAAVAPSAPTITGITAGNGQLSVAFTAPTSSGGASITDYKYSIDGGALVLVGSTSSPFIITGLTNGQLYAVQLYAVNSAGNSLASSAVNGTPLAPSSPTITVAPATFGSAYSTTYGTVSSTQTFAVSGSTLNSDLTVTAPAGLEISLSSGSGYAGSLTLSQTSGAVFSSTIYARLKATAAAGSYNSASIDVSGGGATAQSVSTTSSGNVVGQAALTITGIGIANKVYDRTNTATITGTATYGGLQNGESFSVTGTPSASFATATVGLAKPVAVVGYTAPNSNYTLTQPTLAADISAVALTVTGATVTPKSYDGNTVATINGATLSGVISPDVVTLSGGTSGTFANANVGTGIAVSTTMGITGADAGNYSFTAPTGLVGEITKATAVITFNSLPAGKKVGDGAFSAGATTTAGALSYSSSNPNVATVDGSGDITPVAPGVTTITASVAGAANYNAAAPASQTLNVAAASTPGSTANSTISWNFGTASTSSGAVANLTVGDVRQGNNNGTTALLTTTSGSGTSYAGASAGNNAGAAARIGALSTAAGGSAYFEFILTPAAGYSFTITSISFGARSTSTGPQAYSLRSSADGYASDLSSGVIVNDSTWALESNTGLGISRSAVTTYRIYGHSGAGSPSANSANWRIDDLSLEVTVASPEVPAVPTITPSGSFSALSTTYGTASAASITTVTVTGGSLTADIIATAPEGFEVSSDGATGNWRTIIVQSGFPQQREFANGTLYLRLAANAPAGSRSGNVVLSSTGATSVNVPVVASTVTAKALSVTAVAKTKIYGEADPALTYTSDGLVNGDALSGSLSRAAGTAVGTYAISQGTLANSNYDISFTGANFTITAASLASGDITITPVGDGSYTASATGVNEFSISYSGRTANGVVTSYGPSSTAPTAPGYYTVTATATGNYSGSNTADYFVAGPVAVSDAITKPAGNPSLVLDLASLLANDVRITPAGAVATDGLSITGVTNGSGNSAQIDGGDILFTPGGASPETFTYTLGYGIQTAIGTVTVITESSAPTFTLAIVKLGTAVYSAPNTEVTHDFIGVPNQTYAVEYSTDLTNWTSAGNRSTGATGSFSVTITKSGDVAADWNAHMFFRARLVR